MLRAPIGGPSPKVRVPSSPVTRGLIPKTTKTRILHSGSMAVGEENSRNHSL